MKYNRHTYLFGAIYTFDNKYNLGPRLDYIRNNGIVTVVWELFVKRARPIGLKVPGKDLHGHHRAIEVTR